MCGIPCYHCPFAIMTVRSYSGVFALKSMMMAASVWAQVPGCSCWPQTAFVGETVAVHSGAFQPRSSRLMQLTDGK